MLSVSFISAKKADRSDIDRVIFDDEIYDRITNDYCPAKNDLKMTYKEAVYIGGYVKGRIAALYIVHGEMMHFMVLKEYRKHASELLRACQKEWPYSVYVKIPTLYRSVINFAKKHGFIEVENVKNDFLKNGQLYDRVKLVFEV